MIWTRPGWSPRTASVLATTSSLRMCFLAMCSMVTPAALANSAARSRTRSRSGSGIVEDPDLPRRKKPHHPLGIAGPGQRAGDDDPVVAGEHPGEALAVTLRQQLPQPSLPLPTSPAPILSSLVPAWPA